MWLDESSTVASRLDDYKPIGMTTQASSHKTTLHGASTHGALTREAEWSIVTSAGAGTPGGPRQGLLVTAQPKEEGPQKMLRPHRKDGHRPEDHGLNHTRSPASEASRFRRFQSWATARRGRVLGVPGASPARRSWPSRITTLVALLMTVALLGIEALAEAWVLGKMVESRFDLGQQVAIVIGSVIAFIAVAIRALGPIWIERRHQRDRQDKDDDARPHDTDNSTNPEESCGQR